ncbi:RtcB family protein [Nitrosospira sp. Nsp1]|uniref:RtcB family protein n=1 Tax=Nitrosospira sp. Nsp1 TaxID=136547 RepID=UPI0008924E5F|nr:RtcB family protein [Nitrosospira sp. Nsp1]SCX55321.1 tRNA-splicing ligase RtcB [Nitrosospira sp. Nsp1]
MPIEQVLTDKRVPVKIWTDEVDENSKQQLANIASLPFIHHHVAAMPDVHLGIGAAIGSVIATHKAIIPAALGVDSHGNKIIRGLERDKNVFINRIT